MNSEASHCRQPTAVPPICLGGSVSFLSCGLDSAQVVSDMPGVSGLLIASRIAWRRTRGIDMKKYDWIMLRE